MTDIIHDEAQFLYEQVLPLFKEMLLDCSTCSGDLEEAESAIGSALQSVGSLMVSAALATADRSSTMNLCCPDCGGRLTRWSSQERTIVTCWGEGKAPVSRFRCRKCKTNHYPLSVQNDLTKCHFTIGARELIATEAAEASYLKASVRLGRLGIPISASQTERVAREVGQWRKDEEELVRAHLSQRGTDLALPLHTFNDWKRQSVLSECVLLSVDGGKVRSEQIGEKGLEWFEIRSGVISLDNTRACKARIAGDISPDALFENLRSLYRQCPVQKMPLVFVADGAEWIWGRVRFSFPGAIEVLDIYHASEHVSSAARACWGESDERIKQWTIQAKGMLIELGVGSVIRELIEALRTGQVQDRPEVIKNLRYLLRHRHRMRYSELLEKKLPIGSGVMESTIKQVSSARLRLPGMMWTRQGADLMLRLRAAVLSDALGLTIQRQRKICANRAQIYKTNKDPKAMAV